MAFACLGYAVIWRQLRILLILLRRYVLSSHFHWIHPNVYTLMRPIYFFWLQFGLFCASCRNESPALCKQKTKEKNRWHHFNCRWFFFSPSSENQLWIEWIRIDLLLLQWHLLHPFKLNAQRCCLYSVYWVCRPQSESVNREFWWRTWTQKQNASSSIASVAQLFGAFVRLLSFHFNAISFFRL